MALFMEGDVARLDPTIDRVADPPDAIRRSDGTRFASAELQRPALLRPARGAGGAV